MKRVHESELELPEIFERNERVLFEVEAWPEPPAPGREMFWEKEIGEFVAQVKASAARSAARDVDVTVRLPAPGRIADEMKRRSDFLRSRPLRFQGELGMLSELDTMEALTRALELQRQMGSLTERQVAREMAELGPAVFAVRSRFHDFLRSLGECWPSRATPEEPMSRARELAMIEEFLERKKRGE